MATKLTEFPDNGEQREGYSRYPWKQWMDGSPWELSGPVFRKEMVTIQDTDETEEREVRRLVGDEDFLVTPKSFRSAAAQAARIRQGGIRSTVVKRTVTLKIDGKEVEEQRDNVVIQFVANAQDHEGAEDVTDES